MFTIVYVITVAGGGCEVHGAEVRGGAEQAGDTGAGHTQARSRQLKIDISKCVKE